MTSNYPPGWSAEDDYAAGIRDRPDLRRRGDCDACGWLAPLNPIYDSHAADITMWLCDACLEQRQRALEAMYRGD